MEDLTHQHGGARSGKRRISTRSPTVSIASKASSALATATPSKRKSASVLSGLGFPQRQIGRAAPRSFPAAGRCVSRWPNCCSKKPNLLLLDEPTNHLDLEARNWLEEYLQSLSLRLRADLARPLFPGRHRSARSSKSGTRRVHFYTGNYEKYLGAESRAPSATRGGLPNQRERIEQLEAFINRFRYSGHQGQTGAEPHQGAGEDRAHRDSAGREDHPLLVSAAQAQRPHRGGVQGRGQELRRTSTSSAA